MPIPNISSSRRMPMPLLRRFFTLFVGHRLIDSCWMEALQIVKRSNLLWLLRFFFWFLVFLLLIQQTVITTTFGRDISPIGTVVRGQQKFITWIEEAPQGWWLAPDPLPLLRSWFSFLCLSLLCYPLHFLQLKIGTKQM
jgi:hypothetical protein